MGINISHREDSVTVGTLDINFEREIDVSDDGDSTVTISVPTDSIRTNYENIGEIV